jgi:hypothetical protein
MLRYMDLIQNPCRFLALTGYTVDEFRALLSFFRVRFQAYVARFTLEGKPRQIRTYSTYKNSTFPTMEDTLLFILNYMKTYPIQQTQAQLFGIQQSQANQWILLLLTLVKQALADCGELPARKNEDMYLDEDKAGCFIHDGTERPINRPQDPEEQHLYYSGKQKKHTIKNDIVIDEPCRSHFLSDTVEGKKGGVLIVEMDRNRCQNGPGLDTIPHQGVAHADVHCRSMSSLSSRSSCQTRQNRLRHPALPVPE